FQRKMAKTKNAPPSKKPSRGSSAASLITPPAPPAPANGVPGSSSASTKTTKKLKSQARNSTYNLISLTIIASLISTSTLGLRDHDESHSSDHSLSKSSSSKGAPNIEKAMVPLPKISSRTRSKAKSLKENPPSISLSDSKHEEETEEDQELEGVSDSSEEFVPKEQSSADDSWSKSEVPEPEPVSVEPVAIPAAFPKKDKGKQPIVSPSPILPQKRKRPY
uniref:Uncharacterized protein n=1 Tax=Cannabis sativa TaxID=3483 RepID=A0A803QNI3_CANSA